MTIMEMKVTVAQIYNGFVDSEEEGVKGFFGKLDIRPSYQREFRYDELKQKKVIISMLKGLPISCMYWNRREDGTYECMDGQQRTLSICSYIHGDYSVEFDGHLYFYYNLPSDLRKRIDDYQILVYVCEGSEAEKLEWFKTINIASVPLTEQELRNATYCGTWVTSAKKYFGKRNCSAVKLGEGYVNTTNTLDQKLLETVLKWHAMATSEDMRHPMSIEQYMATHQHDKNCYELRTYFESVMSWVQTIFSHLRKEMKGLPWGEYYNLYKDSASTLDPKEVEARVKELMEDEDVTNKKGIYLYILDGDSKHLSIRTFTERDKRTAFEKQNGVCPCCGETFSIEEMEGDHIVPWSKGGRTEFANLQMLCKKCNLKKSNI